MSKSIRVLVGSAIATVPLLIAQVGEVTAQSLESFAVISGQSLTNTGPTTISGNIAVSPGTSYTGSGSVTQTGETFLGDAVAGRTQNALSTLYTVLSGRPTSNGGNLTGQDLGGQTLSAGVYNFDTSAGLAAGQTLTLDGGGNPDAIFIFNIGSTLTAGSGSSVVLQNGAQGGNVFYRIGSSATLDTSADLVGQIVALTSVTMNTSATIDCGAAYARNGSVTLDSNTIQICTLAGSGFDTVVDGTPPTEPVTVVDGTPPTEPVTVVDGTPPTEPVTVVANTPLNDNQASAAAALSNFVANGGVLPIEIAILAAIQTPDELAASLSQLLGEVSTGVAPMGMQSMDAFLDTVIRSGRNPRTQIAPPRDQEVPIGLVPDRTNEVSNAKYDLPEAVVAKQTLAYAAPAAVQARPWDIWFSGYGSRHVIDSDADRGWHELNSNNSGIAAGLNFSPNSNSDLGIALSWNKADFAVDNSFGTGTSDTVYVALRGRSSSDRGYVEGALAYGRSDIATDRTVTIAGADRLIGETTANSLAAHVEAGYHMAIFTPFVGLRAKSITTQAYSESAMSGSSSYALRYDEATNTSLRTELGISMNWPTDGAASGTPAFGLRAAWAHELASNEPQTRSFVTVPGVAFPVSGVPQDRDSLILASSVGIGAENGLYLDGAVNAEYSSNSQDLGGSLTVGYRW
jgi:uncharacterized protein YhjY with autotransporter beta-barrel domain